MRVTVTGGLGVNGAWVVRELLGRGHEVVVVENREDLTLVRDVADRIELVVGDIRDAERLAAAMRGSECVVHLAAFVAAEQDPQTAIAVNVGGTAQVCASAAAAGVRRVVNTSSKAVYGPTTGKRGFPTYEPIPEDGERLPRGMYDITKSAAEDVLGWYGRTTDLECVSLRFSTIYGPGKLQRHGGNVGIGLVSAYSSMIELPASGLPFALDHGGEERDDLVYVLDVAEAIATVVAAPEPLHHHVYNVSSGRALSVAEFAEVIRSVLPDAQLDVGPGLNPMDAKESAYMVLDNTRIAEDLGWSPRFDPQRAVRHYADHVRAQR
ncbi:NAD(P)-dependent oxidoreductase [Pseudonocardia yuanmonensis]|uniref:NAD(P)-dependent oxidoreductase n=1 Tax=Pseudonocardia yuanmonensis TaxID=1095914 RepID=A0ABP8W9F1_9PSEU